MDSQAVRTAGAIFDRSLTAMVISGAAEGVYQVKWFGEAEPCGKSKLNKPYDDTRVVSLCAGRPRQRNRVPPSRFLRAIGDQGTADTLRP